MSLGGILKHMAWVEDHWFSFRLRGRERSLPWSSVDWAAEPNWEWDSALNDSPSDLRALWAAAVERSRADVEEVLQDGDLSQEALRPSNDGSSPSLRWILVHMIEEYARHNGHADLLRESIDGETGE